MIKYTLELDVSSVSKEFVDVLMNVGTNNGFDTLKQIDDVLVFTSDNGSYFTKLVMELSRVCDGYGIDYFDLLR